MLNKKYKCPVNSAETKSIWDKLSLSFDPNSSCKICNSRLEFTRSTFVKAYIPFALFYMGGVFFDSMGTKIIILLIGAVFMTAYYILFGELEQYIPEEPQYNLKESLDDLKNSNCEK